MTTNAPAFTDLHTHYVAPRAPLPPAADLKAMLDQGITAADIATKYGCSASTVKQRLADSGILQTPKQPAPKAPTTMLEVLLDGAPWANDALCAQTDPEAFFPEKGGSTREAKAVCNGAPGREPCPVRQECLQAALDVDERFGIWGGLSERERRKLKTTQPTGAPLTVAPAPVELEAHACPDCPRTFRSTQGLATHRRHIHTTPPVPLSLVTTRTTSPKETPAMDQPQEQPAQPSYVDQIIAVMAATEGHPDPAVRAARKVVANALVALDKTLRAASHAPAVVPAPTPAVIKPKTSAQPRSKGAGSKAIGDRVAALGVTPRDIRTWAVDNQLDVPTRGLLPGRIVDAYEAAHAQDVA